MPLALDVLSDILTNPAFDPEELAREQNVIMQEIGAAEDTPDDIVFDHLQRTAFPDQPIGRPILGTRESVRSHQRAAAAAISRRAITAARHMVLAATGSVEHDEIVEEAERLFRRLLPAAAVRRPKPARFVGGTYIERQDLEQAHLALALEGLPQRDPLLFSLQVFSNILGGGMSSRLFQEVREMRGLCYSISSFHMAYSDTGFFGIYAGTDDDDAPELMQVVMDEMERAVSTITEAEVARAKAQMKAGLLMALESSSARAEQTGAPDHDLWPTAAAVRNRRQDRGGDRREHASRRPRRCSRAAVRRSPGLGRAADSNRRPKIVENFARAAA